MVDARALESILTNLVQNSVTHGRATQVEVSVRQEGDGRLRVRVADNGCGFQGDTNKLGKLFVRHARSSGSGVGLYIARELLRRMNGAISFQNAGGFVAELDFPEAAGTRASGVLSENPHAGSVRTNYETTVAGRR